METALQTHHENETSQRLTPRRHESFRAGISSASPSPPLFRARALARARILLPISFCARHRAKSTARSQAH